MVVKKYLLFFMAMGLIAVLLMPVCAVFASSVSGAHWHGDVVVTNISSPASGAASVFTANTSAMISEGFINGTATDLAVQDSTGSDIVVQPGWSTNPWCVYLSSIGANTALTYNLYTGNVTGGLIRYFPGAAGMSVSDTLTEPSNNFSWSFTNALLNTAAGASKDILSHYDAGNGGLKLIVSPTTASELNGQILKTNTDAATFPVIGSVSAGHGAGAATINLPLDYVKDDLFIFECSTSSTSGADWGLTSNGWSTLFEKATVGAIFTYHHRVYFKISDGTEGATITGAGTASYSYSLITIKAGTYSGVPVCGIAADGTSSVPNPPALTTGFGDVNTLFLETCNSGMQAQSGYSANYADIGTDTTTVKNYVGYRDYKSASDNPGAFPNSVNDWQANTVAVMGSGCAGEVAATGITAAEHDGALSYVTNYLSNTSFELGNPPIIWLASVGGDITRSSAYSVFGNSSLKMSNAGSIIAFNEGPFANLAGQTVTFGIFCKSALANTSRIEIYDNGVRTYSSFHTGSSSWELLTVTRAVTSTNVYFEILNDGSVANTSYWDGAIAAVGSTLPNQYYNFNLNIDGTLYGTFVDGAVTIPNSTAVWTMCEGDTVYYVDTMAYSQGGAAVSAWTWEYGATFYDSIGANDGTPTFRTAGTDADVSAELTTFSPVTQAKASATIAGGVEPWSTAPSKPSGFTTPSGRINVFFYDLLHSLFQASPTYGTAAETIFWYVMSMLVILVGGFFAQKYGKSIMIKTFAMGALMLGGALSNVYGLWTIIVFACYAFGIIIMSRHYGFG